MPLTNMSEFGTLPPTVFSKTDVPFYTDAQTLLQKVILDV
ncbi:hypothetical protein ABID46_002082 [Moheibacter stercoris]|uniref:Uncharacterized protein n=1 Tax=Moheibacter stercoris TaxID=1628251 RepID=A0ABV2LVB7_9FLAO